ncbi:MSP domain protein [Cooperia oncophora]
MATSEIIEEWDEFQGGYFIDHLDGRRFVGMNLTANTTTFAYLLYILTAVLSLVAKCSKTNGANAAPAASDSTTRESSSASRKRHHAHKKGNQKSSRAVESNELKGTPKKKAETPVEEKEEPPVKSPMKATPVKAKQAEKVEAARKDEAKSVARPLGKEGGDGAMTAADAATDFIDAPANKPVSMILNEPAPGSDPGDGNYEDVNLVEAAAPEAEAKSLLTVEPAKSTFSAAGGKATHTLLNAGDTRVVFKVKCSNNKDYRIKPVYGFVEPIGSHLVFVVRLAGPVKDDKMVIQFGLSPPDISVPVVAFKKLPPNSLQQLTIPFTVVPGAAGATAPAPGAPASPTTPSPSPSPSPNSKPTPPKPPAADRMRENLYYTCLEHCRSALSFFKIC